ncbi:hypothetical protein BTE77_27965 [Ensifer adhaerens]|nr:hypothetical protein BTE77_27965 [Ensifer adhaerens]
MITRINTYREAAIATFKSAMPELLECAPQFGRFNIEDLETSSVRAPGLRVGILSAKMKPAPAGNSEALLNCAAFAITEGKSRDEQAWALAESIAVLLHPAQLFAMTHLSGPSEVAILPAITGKLKSKNVSIIAIEWKQTLRQLGLNLFDDTGEMYRDLYINGELAQGNGNGDV